jgi:hypothetical protein
MRGRHHLTFFLTIAAFLLCGPSFAETTEFAAPTYKGHLLDWCLNWGSACGAPAANA